MSRYLNSQRMGDDIDAVEAALLENAQMCREEAKRRIRGDRSGGRPCGRCEGCRVQRALKAFERIVLELARQGRAGGGPDT